MRIDGQRAVTKARSISFVARAALICLIKNPHDTFRKPRTWSFVLPAWRRNQCSGLRAWKLRDGKYFFADVPIARTCFERTPITTPNVYKVRSPMTVYSARRGVVPRRRKMNSLGLKLRGVTGFGQTNGKNGSHIHLAFYFEFCVMLLHNSFANGKAYPCA